MPSDYETFWEHERYAVIGHSSERPFPRLTYANLKKNGKTVYPVDPSVKEIAGDPTFADLGALPGPVDGVVIEVPKEETAAWVERAAEAGIRDVWLHMNTDTDEALALADERGLDVRHGTCAVMYVRKGFSIHGLHRWINKRRGKY